MTKIALIWASNNPDKFWNKILVDLVSKGYIVYPVNPKSKYINDIKVFKNISELWDNIDVFNFVIPPLSALKVLKDHKDFLLDKYLWFQPWSNNIEVDNYLKENNFLKYKINSCIMINKI
jgi:predicted CoA-binding protein